MAEQLEYFLIRTLPSKKKRIPRMFGNRATAANKRKVAGIKVQLAEREAAALKGLLHGTSEYSPALSSHLRGLVSIRDCDRSINGLYAFASLQGSMKESKYHGARVYDRKPTCLTNYTRTGNSHLRSAFSYKNIVGICTNQTLLLYDANRISEGAIVGVRGCFGGHAIYKNEVWVLMQRTKMYSDSDVGCLDVKKVLNIFEKCTEIPEDVFAAGLKHSDVFESILPIKKSTTDESMGLVVDYFQCYLAYKSEVMVLKKRTSSESLRKIKYPRSNLDRIAGRGTRIVYASTLEEITAYETPHLRHISSVDTYNKKERKIVSVKLVRGVELVFAVGQNTGGVSIFCLLGRKMARVAWCDELSRNPISPQPTQYFPDFFVEDSRTGICLFGYHKPVWFSISWT